MRTGICGGVSGWRWVGEVGGTYREADNDQVAGDVEGGDSPPEIWGLAVDVALGHVDGPVPEGGEWDAGGKDGYDEP